MRTVSRVVALLTSGILLAACGEQTPRVAPAEPVGEVLDLSAEGLHELQPAPLSDRGVGIRVWTGDRLVMWGGTTHSDDANWASLPTRILADGATLSLEDGRWTPMPPSPFPQGLYQPLGAWDGTEVIVIGTECDPVVPPVTEGGPPACPGGPAAAAWEPSTERWRLLPPPPVPVDPDYRQPILTHRQQAIGGDGTAVFSFGRNGTTVVWDRAGGGWSTIEPAWDPEVRIELCSDVVRSQVVAATARSTADAATAWTLAVGSDAWSEPIPLGVPIEEGFSCGDGAMIVDRYGSDGSSGDVIDLGSGARTPAFEPTPMSELRNVSVVGPWMFSHSLTGSVEHLESAVAVRRISGGEWMPYGDDRGPIDVPAPPATFVGDGFVDGHLIEASPLVFWRAPAELAG